MKKTFAKTLVSFLSFSVFLLLVTFSFDHINAQNSGDLSPAAKEAFIQTMNDEIIDLRMEMHDSGVNSENNLAIFNYYIAVRDFYINNSVELNEAFGINVSILGKEDAAKELLDVLVQQNNRTSNDGSVLRTSTTGSLPMFAPTEEFQYYIDNVVIEETEILGLDQLFSFIRSHK